MSARVNDAANGRKQALTLAPGLAACSRAPERLKDELSRALEGGGAEGASIQGGSTSRPSGSGFDQLVESRGAFDQEYDLALGARAQKTACKARICRAGKVRFVLVIMFGNVRLETRR